MNDIIPSLSQSFALENISGLRTTNHVSISYPEPSFSWPASFMFVEGVGQEKRRLGVRRFPEVPSKDMSIITPLTIVTFCFQPTLPAVTNVVLYLYFASMFFSNGQLHSKLDTSVVSLVTLYFL